MTPKRAKKTQQKYINYNLFLDILNCRIAKAGNYNSKLID